MRRNKGVDSIVSRKVSRKSVGDVFPLSLAVKGDAGVIVRVGTDAPEATHARTELERRLLEMGFVEGARVRVLHEGFIGRDPIAVQLDDMRVALRRREAADVLVRRNGGPHE
jgi:ferrous iron transport protein A